MDGKASGSSKRNPSRERGGEHIFCFILSFFAGLLANSVSRQSISVAAPAVNTTENTTENVTNNNSITVNVTGIDNP